jgi:carbon starvation protein
VATSSALYLALPVVMGLLLRFTRLGWGLATLIFLPLVGVSIWLGQRFPIDLAGLTGLTPAAAHTAWTMILLAYCLAASLVPMWLLLQPRGHLGGYFLYASLMGGALGLVLTSDRAAYPAFTGWHAVSGEPLFPILFITIACGACSGFHAIVASGTTSKQLRTETDAKLVGYGAMLLEAMVAVVSLSCVMRLTQDAPLLASPKPNFLYAQGIGSFLGALGIPPAYAVAFALMAFTTFVYDTLDVCTRLGRYIIEELTGWRGPVGKTFAALLTVGVPAFFLMYHSTDAVGRGIPAWKLFWELFGASNQLLAALTLLGLTVWLWHTRRQWWVWAVLGIPTALMYVMSTWALVRIIGVEVDKNGLGRNPVPWVGMLLVALAVLMIGEAALAFLRPRVRPIAIGPAEGEMARA